MRKVATDEERARFRQVVLPYLTDCYGLARWLTGDRADAEDVVQEACLNALRAISGFAGTNARAWILTIVRHTAYNWLRKNRSAALVVVEDPEAIQRAGADYATNFENGSIGNPEAALIAKTEAARLERAIAELPIPFRETLVLRDVQGLDYREIAQVTDVPIGTVMSRLARARNRLIAILGTNTS
jgi:RNA polymerase sigma-70 factor (ECF subfamily)